MLYDTYEKFIVQNLNAPHKWGIQDLKEYYVHVAHGPTQCSQQIVQCYAGDELPILDTRKIMTHVKVLGRAVITPKTNTLISCIISTY